MRVGMRCSGRGVLLRLSMLAVAVVSLAACHTEIDVRARTRAIAEAAEAPNPPERSLALQFSIETPSTDACHRVSGALPQRGKAYGLEPSNIKCVDSETGHFVQFNADVPLLMTPNKSGAVKGPVPHNVLFQAFVDTFSHVMRARRMGTGYTLTLLYNEPLFAALQADLMKEDPLHGFDLSEMSLSLDLTNDLGTNEVAQLSSAFVGEDPVVHSNSYSLVPQQSINAVFSNVAVADFGKRHSMTLASFYPAD